jgi:putative glutamine amidotransferase
VDQVRPWIGITTYTADAQWAGRGGHVTLLPTSYAESVNRAGGRAVLIPADDPGSDALDRLDALVVSGGPDVDPERYGQSAHPTSVWQAERDVAELTLLRAALERDLPVLGVCRGAQLMAVEAGGALHQHLPDTLDHGGHRPASERGAVPSYGRHAVRLAPGTLLHKILGDEVVANSLHHQGIAHPGRLTAVGWSTDDDLIEAVEDPERTFAIGVQWHPEDLPDATVWNAFVEAARRV